jgi:hypothetical protein
MLQRRFNSVVFLLLVRMAALAIRAARSLAGSHPLLRYEIT